MSDGQHDLASEFPAYKETIHNLKMTNDHFRRLMDRYHELNKAISRSEQRIDLRSDREEGELRKERLKLKDELSALLIAAGKGHP